MGIASEEGKAFLQDEKWMRLALEQARLAQAIDEVPVGAVLVQDGQLIASAHNQPIKNNDPTAHAEIQILRAAGKKIQQLSLPKYNTVRHLRALHNVPRSDDSCTYISHCIWCF